MFHPLRAVRLGRWVPTPVPMIKACLPALLLVSALAHLATAEALIPRQATVSKEDSTRIVGFLDLLSSARTPASSQGGYDPSRAGPWNTDKLAAFVAQSGITFHDVNGDTTWHLAPDSLRQQLRRRRGSGFDMLLHLGYVYGLRYPQYSSLAFVQNSSGVVVRVFEGMSEVETADALFHSEARTDSELRPLYHD